jgi:hypothetical protein
VGRAGRKAGKGKREKVGRREGKRKIRQEMDKKKGKREKGNWEGMKGEG